MHVWYVYCQNMKYYLLYIKSILFLKLKIIFLLFLSQFESKTVCPRSLAPIHILGYYENKSEIAIRNVSRVCWKLKVFRRKFLYLLFCHISGIQQKKLFGYLANQFSVHPNQNLIYFNRTLLLPLSFFRGERERQMPDKTERKRESQSYMPGYIIQV